MDDSDGSNERRVKAVHALTSVNEPTFINELADYIREQYCLEGLQALQGDYREAEGALDTILRISVWKASLLSCGPGLTVGTGVAIKHPETFAIGERAFIGRGVNLQGRYDGRCIIGDGVWIGPDCFFDARDLTIEDQVGIGPGVRILGSEHTAQPISQPIIETDLLIKPVRIARWADIGTGATLLPGITVGQGAIVGAGAVVTKDVPDFAVVAGVPAVFLHWREGFQGDAGSK